MSLQVQTVHLDEDGVEEVATDSINAVQHCGEGADFCDYFFLFKRDFVDHDNYLIKIEFPDPHEYVTASSNDEHDEPLFEVESRVTSINPDFTRFEIGWKYFWLCMTLVVMFCPCGVGFLSALKRKRRDTGQERTYHQAWTAVLLWGLLLFDDPFVGVTVYTDAAKAFSAFFILSASIFVFLILLFWMCFLSDLGFMKHGEGNVHRGVCYWIPKVRHI